jgi:hypothetical protein
MNRWLPWVMALVYVGAAAVSTWADLAVGTFSLAETLTLGIAFTAFLGVGVAIAVRAGHVIGWLFIGIALYAMAQNAMASVGEYLIRSGGSHIVYALSNVVFHWPTLLAVMVVVVPLLFPTGRLPSPRWRWLAWTFGVALAVSTLLNLFQRDVCFSYTEGGDCVESVANPIGLQAVENFEESTFGGVLLAVLAVCVIGAGASVVSRFRAASGVERAQLKWIALSVGLFLAYLLIVDIVLGTAFGLDEQIARFTPDWLDPFGLFLAFVPMSVGFAILRYRLYDIDRIVSRTVSYGVLTVILVATYAGLVVATRQLLPDQSDLSVAASTLAVAALFNPLRRKVQQQVDRRFNRSRFDRARVVADFTGEVRSQRDLGQVQLGLLRTAVATMQPACISLWTNPGGEPREPAHAAMD